MFSNLALFLCTDFLVRNPVRQLARADHCSSEHLALLRHSKNKIYGLTFLLRSPLITKLRCMYAMYVRLFRVLVPPFFVCPLKASSLPAPTM